MAEPPPAVIRYGLSGAIRTLLRAWWGSDRIRTSPTAGRMLALKTGDRFLLRDRIWIVTSRDIKCRESSAHVRLEIRSESENQSAELICGASNVLSARLEPAGLRIDEWIIPIRDEDVSLLPSTLTAAKATV